MITTISIKKNNEPRSFTIRHQIDIKKNLGKKKFIIKLSLYLKINDI